jgi:hypothetical protein
MLQTPNVVRLQRAEPLAPRVDPLLGDTVPLGNDRHWIAIRLAQDRYNLLVREP